MSQEAHIKERKSIYAVWIIPILAMAIAAWMIFKYYDNKGYDVLITFDSGSGMSIGKTPLIYNGIKIGKVTDIKIHPKDISKIDVIVTVKKSAVGVAKEGNIFWKVEPTLSLTEVTGLSTILSGVYIGVMPSVKDPNILLNLPPKYVFEASNEAPVNIFHDGKTIILHAQKNDVKVGAPIMYRKMNIGKVVDAKLSPQGIDYYVNIDKKYTSILKEDSKFWKISGIEVRASLAGLRVEMESLASVVAGGIELSSPENSNIVKDMKHQYKLYDDKKYLSLADNIITLVSSQGYNIDIKAAHLFFKGSNAGDIIDLDYNPATNKTTFKIKLKKKFLHLANKDAYFWIIEPAIGLKGIKGLGAIAQGPYISFITKSKSKELKKKFTLHKKPSSIKGKYFKLIADDSFNLKDGIDVIYRNIIIGTMTKSKLAKDKQSVSFDIVIANKYKDLVNDSSAFYIENAFDTGASFDGVYLNIGSLSSMVNGGIVLHTSNLNAPKSAKIFELVKNYKTFLANEYVDDGGKFFTLIADNLNSVKINSYILYKGIKVGKVLSYKLDQTTKNIKVKTYIKKEYSNLINNSTNFYNISGVEIKASLDGIKINTGSIESIVTGGIAFKTPLKAALSKNMDEFTLYKDEDAVDERYTKINFLTKEDTGLKLGSKIIYKSIIIGQISDMKLVDDEVILSALIKDEYKNLLVDDSKFWIEDVAINIDSIENPSAILSGAFIKLLRGRSKNKTNKFFISHKKPVATANKKGLRVIATASKLSSLKVGSPIFYRQIKIGSVEAFKLTQDSSGIELKLFIDECYTYLVRNNSIFYNATAMGMDVSLFGIKISTETVSTMIKGGITMVVPDDADIKAEELHEFKLYDAPKEDWLQYAPKLTNDMSTCREDI